MAGVNSVKIAPAYGGMNSEASPEYVAPTQAAVLENLLPRPGKAVLRGPISSDIDLGIANFSRISGSSVWDSGILINYNAGSQKEIQSAVVTAGAGAPRAGIRSCRLGAYAYSIRGTDFVRWDGAGAAELVADGPAATDLAIHLSRVFTLGTIGGLNKLKWTDAGGPVALLPSDWQDDVSGLTNQIVVGDENDVGVALGHVGKQLGILKSRSLWLLSGLTPSTFSVNRVTSEWGCVSTESVVDHDDGCFFLSDRGYAYFDGSNVVDVSQDVRTELLTALRAAPFPYSAAAGTHNQPASLLPFARAANIGRDCIMLTIGREYTDTALVPTIYFCGIYDTGQRTWTRFSSDAFTAGAPVYFIETPASSYYAGATLGYDASGNLFYMDDIVSPEAADPTLAGTDLVDGTTATIPAVSHSRIVALSSPGRTSQLKRLLFDYSFVVVADGETSVDCCSVSLVDGQGNVLLAATPIQATILASGYTDAQRRAALVRKRFQVECWAETSEVQLRITLPALDPDVTEVIAAELFDATIEFIPGRDRPTY